MSLSKKVFLITGAGGGLGRIAAVTLAQQGAEVILLDKSIPQLEKTYDAIIAAHGATPNMYPFDLAGANEQDYYELAERIETHYGALHGLLHSATDIKAFTPLSCLSTRDWGNSLNVNLNAPFLLCQVLCPLLEQSEHASIVFTLDSAVLAAPAYASAYGVAKAGLQALAHILAAEHEGAGKIRVNCLIPGPVDSPLRKRTFPGEDKSKLPDPASLAPIYLYLFSAASLGITGQTIDARTFHL